MSQNLLHRETSPYLRQHVGNPVHWRAWSAETLRRAQDDGKPILLSIGYAACHWCHVMAHESFENEDIAAIVNALYTPIKVDREERPDIDAVYMAALHRLGVPGGWPLTMFLTPRAEPFWGGTYFPPSPRGGHPGFPQILRAVARFFAERREEAMAQTELLKASLAQIESEDAATIDEAAALAQGRAELACAIDVEAGGFGASGPKFPHFPALSALWRSWRYDGDERARDGALKTVEAMLAGGIYDAVGGGMHRYAVDRHWRVPHFEKMLYDNAQLIDLLATIGADIETGGDHVRLRLEETIAWLQREMMTPQGAFAASLDADSEGEEGRFYVWKEDEIEAVLRRDGVDEEAIAGFRRVYDIAPGGNWEGVCVLNRLSSPRLGDRRREAMWKRCLKALRAARENRVRPERDEKILADWNGLTIAALARAARAMNEPAWMKTAAQVYEATTRLLSVGDRLFHCWCGGRRTAAGMAEDYAAMIAAALSLYEGDGAPHYLADARRWMSAFDRFHWVEEEAAYRMVAADADDVPLRLGEDAGDGATPSAQGTALADAARLWLLTGEESLRRRAERLSARGAQRFRRGPLTASSWANGCETLRRAERLLVTGENDDDAVGAALHATARRHASPDCVLVREAAAAAEDDPLAAAARKPRSEATAIHCRAGVCASPCNDPEALSGVLRRGQAAPLRLRP